jgi:hypothetical protein
VGEKGKGDIPCGEDISFVCCNDSTALLSSYKSARAYEGNSLAYDNRLFISRNPFFRVLYHFPEISKYQHHPSSIIHHPSSIIHLDRKKREKIEKTYPFLKSLRAPALKLLGRPSLGLYELQISARRCKSSSSDLTFAESWA